MVTFYYESTGLSQRKTLAYLVFGMMNARKASLIAIAKGMKSKTSVKHNLKRVARFMANKSIDIKKSMTTMVIFICGILIMWLIKILFQH